MRNHYVTLELMQDASPREIVYAYRHLARKLHPDLHPEDPDAAERFRAVHEAYEVLSDPAARQRHDAELIGDGVVPPGGIPAPPQRTARARPAPAARAPYAYQPVAHTAPRRKPRPLLRRPWWEPPLYGLLLFAAGSITAIGTVGWHAYEEIGGVLGVVLFLGSALYALQSLVSDAVTRR